MQRPRVLTVPGRVQIRLDPVRSTSGAGYLRLSVGGTFAFLSVAAADDLSSAIDAVLDRLDDDDLEEVQVIHGL